MAGLRLRSPGGRHRASRALPRRASEGGVPFLKARGELGEATTALDERVHAVRCDRPPAQVAYQLLLITTVVIDDFHHLRESEQLRIVRGLRAIIFEGVPVILVGAAPRLRHCPCGNQTTCCSRLEPVLDPCYAAGDRRVGIRRAERIAKCGVEERLVAESFGSPFLCRCSSSARRTASAVCKRNGIIFMPRLGAVLPSAQQERRKVNSSSRWLRRAHPRELNDGRTVDIYHLVLAAIAHTGPKTSISDAELLRLFGRLCAETHLVSHEVTRGLR